jgi:hypothetical protein
MMGWGDFMLAAAGGGKRRGMQWTLAGDEGLRSLSYVNLFRTRTHNLL